jgi:acetyl-CoA acetyltransferase
VTTSRDWGHATPFDDVNGDVAIVGIGETEYTKASGRTAQEIGAEAAAHAIADAGLEPADIDGFTYSGAFADFDVAAFHDHFGTTHEMWSSHWGGGMSWAGTAPYLAAKAIGAGKARHVLNVFPVAWATQRSSMTGGRASRAVRQLAEPQCVGWFPQPVTAAMPGMLEFGTVEEQFGGSERCR